MRRVVAFLEWKSNDWLSKRETRSASVACDIQSGLDAYARKQAAVYRDLSTSFAAFWRSTLASYDLDHSWATECLQRHGMFLPAGTPASRKPGLSEHQTVSNTVHNQIDQLAAPPTPHTHDPPGAHDADDGTFLDEADLDSSTDTSSSGFDGFESESDDDDDDDGGDYDGDDDNGDGDNGDNEEHSDFDFE